ncbi:HAD family hydrolase [Mycoplasmopsis felifaucium]|uniref:HAD family hydrolase n=1 Tax=Mycoplasmopsis felifaucium TaxID=35768 RepID=A0ABZ2RSZ9_9BACT
MNKKIFAYDLDGTLLMSNNTINEYTKIALEKVQEKGWINVLNTGRGLLKVLPLIDEFKNFDYFICSNGALIYDVKAKKIIIVGKLDSDAFEQMFEFAKNNQLIMTVDTTTFNGSYVPRVDGKLPEWCQKQDIMDLAKLNVSDYDEMKNAVMNPEAIITQMAIRSYKGLAEKVTEYFKTSFKGKYSVYLTNSIYTDINPLNISKWHGLEFLLKTKNLSSLTSFAFGDSGNDVEMLTHADYSFAMSNATKEAKEVASEIIGDYNSDAIGIKLMQIINNS